MKTVTNQYILNLSISDAIFLLDLPLIIVGGLLKRWIFGLVMCKVYFATTGINMFTGSFTLAVLSGDRYLAVCHPTKAVVYRTAKNARIVILLTWLISVLLLTPVIVYANISPQFVPQNISINSSSSSSSSTPFPLTTSTADVGRRRFQRNPFWEAGSDWSEALVVFNRPPFLRSKERQEETSNVTGQEMIDEVVDELKAMMRARGIQYEGPDWSGWRAKEKRKTHDDDVSQAVDEATTTASTSTATASRAIQIRSGYTCTVDWPQDYIMPAVHAYIVYNMVVGFVIPVMVISILYTSLVIKLSKDPNQIQDTRRGQEEKASFGKAIKKTFLSKESSFGRGRGESFRMKKRTSSPLKTPTIQENQILAYETPPEVMKNIGAGDDRIRSAAIFRDDELAATSKSDAENLKSHSTVKAPPVSRNVSAFKQRRLQQPRITRLVTSIILVYVVCWLPYWAFQLHLLTNLTAVRDSKWKLTLYHLFTFLSYCNSAINPILYVFTNQNFRDSFVGAVQCREDVGGKGRAATGQFKASPRVKTAKETWTPKLNGPRKNLTRFHSCSPNIPLHIDADPDKEFDPKAAIGERKLPRSDALRGFTNEKVVLKMEKLNNAQQQQQQQINENHSKQESNNNNSSIENPPPANTFTQPI